MSDNGHGVPLQFDSKPFSGSAARGIDGAEILTRVFDFIRRFVHLSVAQATIAAIWIAHTYGIDAATITLYLAISSATKQSGKTRLLEVFELLVNKPWLTGRVTAACLIRKVDQVRPTLLLDESDAAFSGEKEYAEALRGVLNTGFCAGGVASCCVGQGANITFKDFKTYCAKAIAGIGNLPETVADRSIPIRLQRKRPGETVARFRRRYAKHEAAEIKASVSDWISSIVDHLKEAEPCIPDELTDRQQDGIEPLLAIADEAGGTWPETLRAAVLEIFRSEAAEDQNIGVQLLGDLRAIFDATQADKMFTADLLTALKEIETSPWADWGNGKGLTPHALSKLLKPFGIAGPRSVRVEDETAKGYRREWFEDAFERYLPHVIPRTNLRNVTPLQSKCFHNDEDIANRHKKPDVTDHKSASKPCQCWVVTECDESKVAQGWGGHERNLPQCPKCGSFALYRDGTCETCRLHEAGS